jgi:L-2-hydroxyglutarate oxidase LhgO
VSADFSTLVVGAGVVGLAIARALCATGRDVVVLEREAACGLASSARNSGVIHAGIYYPRASLKAQLCVRGSHLLYDYCAERGVPHARCGKLIVAADAGEVPALREYLRRGLANGVGRLEWLDGAAAVALEPALSCQAALLSPDTGIVDAPALVQSLQSVVEALGGRVVLRTTLLGVEPCGEGFRIKIDGAGPSTAICREVVNASGLEASVVARSTRGLDPASIPVTRYARGHYYALAGAPPFSRLVYPLPSAGGLGVHATLDLAGRVRFGPDVEWIDVVDYRFGADRHQAFAEEIRRYFPAIDAARLAPDYTGIRPKLHAPGDAVADFRIDGPEVHGLDGLVNLYGIESPGLTSSLAIAELIVERLDGGRARAPTPAAMDATSSTLPR